MTEPTLVYFAEPIDQSGKRHPDTLALWTSLDYSGHGLFRARDGFTVPKLDPRVEQINRYALYRADCIVAHLPAGVPTIGVPAEIEAATARGIPAVVLTEVLSQALIGNRLVTVIDKPSKVNHAVSEAIKNHPRYDPAVKIVLRHETALPARSYADDAGLDLTTSVGTVIGPGEYADIDTQVDAVQLPDGYWGLITARSSTLRRHGMFVPPAIIDPGWRGPLYVGAWNLTQVPITVHPGDRLGQLILIPAALIPPVAAELEHLDPHPRGVNGFGSTGR